MFSFPLPSTFFCFTVTYNVDMSFPIEVSLMFGLTTGRVGSYTAVYGFVADFEEIGIVVYVLVLY